LGDYGTAGFSVTSSDVNDMDVTTVTEPDGTGETFGYADIAVSLAYALKLTDHFSIGFNPKYIHQRIWRMNASAFAFDLGMRYDTPFEGVVLGMAISNFGEKMQLRGGNTLVLHDPNPEGSGNNDRIPADLSTEEWALPLNFKVGLAFHVLQDETNRLVLAVDASHPSDNYESINIGGEYIFSDFISFRSGYKSLFLSNTDESYTFGFGLQQYFLGSVIIHVDYAYQDFHRLRNIQKFSLGINF
ncbi:MAG: PorV/PorQ family protein, partial [Bacteriovoracaceae bacterium]